MSTLRRLKRPDFEGAEKFGVLRTDFFTMDLKRALWDCMPPQWPWREKADVLIQVEEDVQCCFYGATYQAPAVTVSELRDVQERARALLQALAGLSQETRGTLEGRIVYLARAMDAPEPLSKHARSQAENEVHMAVPTWWDMVQDIEAAACFAAGEELPSRADRPAITNAKRLVFNLAGAIYAIRGALPPHGKGTWFPVFAYELGEGYGLKCGLDLVAEVLKQMKNDARFPKREPRELKWIRRAGFTPPVSSPD